MLDFKQKEWNESYTRGENAIFYPHEEVVRFLNRFIRKRVGERNFSDVIYRGDFYHSGVGITHKGEIIETASFTGGGGVNELYPLKALDFGCGIGRQSMLLDEFGIEAFGIDISQVAIAQAQSLAQKYAHNKCHFRIYDGQSIPFEDEYFDFTMSYGVLDSLPFELAKHLVAEIARVSKTYFFCSLIGEDCVSSFSNIDKAHFSGEIEVQEAHEKGTIQSFFDMEKISLLFAHTPFSLIWGEKKQALNLLNKSVQSRYYIVLRKDK